MGSWSSAPLAVTKWLVPERANECDACEPLHSYSPQDVNPVLGFPPANQVPFTSEFAYMFLSAQNRARPGRSSHWLGRLRVVRFQSSASRASGPAVFVLHACVLCSEVCNFLRGRPVCGALAVSRIKPGDFAPHCPGAVGVLQLFCLWLSGQGPRAPGPLQGEPCAGKARTRSLGH